MIGKRGGGLMVLMGLVGTVKCVLEDFWQGLRQRRRRCLTPCLLLLVVFSLEKKEKERRKEAKEER